MKRIIKLYESNIYRLLQTIEPLLAKKINIIKDRTRWKSWQMLQSNLYNFQRIGKRKRRVIPGKKKAYTVKTEILMERNGKSIQVICSKHT
ncbi:hypothetical protein BIY23_01165 [Wolbachia pipientis]|uniref:Uncharacterized protein n=1 Tax=Wolbachia pipientis TaxID=955 RepID=A0A1E7QKS1_WOLPI|nr:hypothetical protein BIY23_01165 [Wolbachia pipientis]